MKEDFIFYFHEKLIFIIEWDFNYFSEKLQWVPYHLDLVLLEWKLLRQLKKRFSNKILIYV